MLCAAALLALSCAGAAFAPLRWIVLGADFLFVLLFVFDFLRTPRPDRLSVRRRLPGHAGLSQDFARSLRIDVSAIPSAAGLELELHEQFSPAFEVRGRTLRTPRASAAKGPSTDSTRTSPVAKQSSTPPLGFAAPLEGDPSGGPDVTLLPATGPIDLVRIYRSSRRGVHALGDMRLRLRGRLGLVQRQARMRGAQSIEVEPALLNLKHTLELAASERWRDLGLRYLRRRGGMTEFESLREHVQGDDLRMVDWKAFAKRGRPIVRQFQEERGQEMILVFDCGRRMSATSEEVAPSDAEHAPHRRTGGARSESALVESPLAGTSPSNDTLANASARSPDVPELGERSSGQAASAPKRRAPAPLPIVGWTKLDHALDAGLQIAAVALQRGDRVGALAFDSKVRAFVPPSRGSRQLERLRDALFALEASALESDLERALRELALRHRRRALVLILSDVADPLSLERQRVALATGSRRHKILFATLDDPSLRAAAEGTARVGAAVRAAAMELQEERRQSLRRLSNTGARVLDTLPAEAAAPLLAAWLEARRGGG